MPLTCQHISTKLTFSNGILHHKYNSFSQNSISNGEPKNHQGKPRNPHRSVKQLSSAYQPLSITAIQPKLTINALGDLYEQEADLIATKIMNMAEPKKTLQVQRELSSEEGDEKLQTQSLSNSITPLIQRETSVDGEEEEQTLQMRRSSFKQATADNSFEASSDLESRLANSKGRGNPLCDDVRSLMEPRFETDFSQVRVHTDDTARQMNQELNAQAFTHKQDIYFDTGRYNPNSRSGRELLAHELTHVVQQNQILHNSPKGKRVVAIQRQENEPEKLTSHFTEPLDDSDWKVVDRWKNEGKVNGESLTEDLDYNALLVAGAIFCNRALTSLVSNGTQEDPLLCVDSSITRSDIRVQQLVKHVTARGPIKTNNWIFVDKSKRMLYVMRLLVDKHGYSDKGAAGLVGNLMAESSLIPNRIEGSSEKQPMKTQNFENQSTDFTAEQVMNRNPKARKGAKLPGVGLAQWTTKDRREGLFQHTFEGRKLGAAILFDMDAQVDYLDTELQRDFSSLYKRLKSGGVSVEEASDKVVTEFERPVAIVDALKKNNLNDAAAQKVFAQRRPLAQRAFQVFEESKKIEEQKKP